MLALTTPAHLTEPHVVTHLRRYTPIHASLQTHSAKATLHRGADGCHVNMPGRLDDWVVTCRMSWRSREEGRRMRRKVVRGAKQKL